MKLDSIDLRQITLLHDSNIKFIEGQMHEPINDIEIRYNIEEKWADEQPKLAVLVFEVVLGLCLLSIAAAFWFNIIVALASDMTTLTSEPPSDVIGILAINVIILLLTGLFGWAGLYLLKFVYTQYRDKDEQPTPDAIFETMLIEGELEVGRVVMFLNPEHTQVALNIGDERDVYVLYEASRLRAGDTLLILQYEQYIGIL